MSVKLIGQRQAARILGINETKLVEWTKAGVIPCVQDTRKGLPWFRWSETALIAWQEETGRQAAIKAAS